MSSSDYIVQTETIWLEKPNIVSIWSLAEKVCSPLFSAITFLISTVNGSNNIPWFWDSMILRNSVQFPIQTWISTTDQWLGDISSMFLGGTQTIETYQKKKAQRLHSSWSGQTHPRSVGDRRHLGSGSILGLWELSQAGETHRCPGVKMEAVKRNQCWSMGQGTRRRGGAVEGEGVTMVYSTFGRR